MKYALVYVFLFATLFTYSQEYFPENSGVKTTKISLIAFTNAIIYVTPSEVINNGTLLIKNGKVENIGTSIQIPNDAKIIDLKGNSIYPSFIDLYTDFGIEKPKRTNNSFNSAQYDPTRSGYYWNDHIRPETNPIDIFKFDNKKAKEFIEAGFGVVNTHLQDGIVRGNGLLIALNANANNGYRFLDEKSAQYLSFKRSVQTNQSYPNSLMGSMALLRQMYLDGEWYSKGNLNNKDLSLEALNKNKGLVQIFEAGSKLNDLRADKVGDQYGIQYVIVGGGDEYENLAEIKATNASFIIPINFRKPYDVSDPYLANEIDLSDMRKWNQEPANPGLLNKNGIRFSLTTHNLKSISEFSKNLQKAINYGLDKTAALEALTTIPAKILGKENEIGSLQKGTFANFLITSGNIFDEETILYENWVQGEKNVINDRAIKDISGNYELTFNNSKYNLAISGKTSKPSATIKDGKTKLKSTFSFKNNWVNISITDTITPSKSTRLNARVFKNEDNLKGIITDINGHESEWVATKILTDTIEAKKNTATEKIDPVILPITFPNKAFGFIEKPKQEIILFKNCTVWTNEKEGILENTDVLIKDGKIVKIGKNLKTNNAIIIDGTGKHITAGIIDEHSHIAADAINEGGQNSSAEVTLEDVLNPDDIKIYRNLAGGVTSLQVLHGSANPIGGRSAIIKMKWGASADEMLIKNNDKFIKFALGENVKQSRSRNGTRFPQTRMGVEEVYMDYFQRAKEYDQIRKSGKPYRKDIEMETLAEILNSKRFISCHSYVQSEINMLMKVADKFNFKINTFTHILEGYKVADKMKEHGVGASTFSDWWAYKYEVSDAIPYNASIMHNLGITVAINSDDAEMGRRLNQEAAKTMKYGDVTEEDAWKFVTLNPAKLLHLDQRIGSLKEGKDADVVLWSGHPLSIYSKAEKTLVDGILYFDIHRDLQLRNEVKNERNTLINMMLNEKSSGKSVQSPKKKTTIDFHCDTVLNF